MGPKGVYIPCRSTLEPSSNLLQVVHQGIAVVVAW